MHVGHQTFIGRLQTGKVHGTGLAPGEGHGRGAARRTDAVPAFALPGGADRAERPPYCTASAGRTRGGLGGPAGARPGTPLFALGMVLAAGGWMLLESAHAPGLAVPLVAAIGLAFAAPFAGDW